MQELFYTLAIYFQSFAYYFQAGDMRTPAFALLPVCPPSLSPCRRGGGFPLRRAVLRGSAFACCGGACGGVCRGRRALGGRLLHVEDFDAVLDGLQAGGHFGEDAYAFFLRPRLLGDECPQVAVEDGGGYQADDGQYGSRLLCQVAADVG